MDNEKGSVKYVLNLVTDATDRLKEIFSSEEFSVVGVDQLPAEASPSFVIVRDLQGSFFELDQKYNTVQNNIPVISLSQVMSQLDFMGFNGRAYFPVKLLDSDVGKVLVKRYFTGDSTILFEQVYDGILKRASSLKITGHLHAGHYSDLIAASAFEDNFNIMGVRRYLVGMLSFLAYMRASKIAKFPLDVDYGKNDKAFVVQFTIPVHNFVLEYLHEAFNENGNGNTLQGLLLWCLDACNLLDIYYLEKSSKLVITALWLKDIQELGDGYFNGLLMGQIHSFQQGRKKWQELNLQTEIAVDVQEEQKMEELENRPLPGESVQLMDTDFKGLEERPELLQKIIDYIVGVRKKDERPKEAELLAVEDVDIYLVEYPDSMEINELTDIDKKLIISCLGNQEVLTMVQNIEEVAPQVEEVAPAEETVLVEEAIIPEVAVIKGAPEEKEEVAVIKGGPPEKQEVTVLKSSPKEKEEVTVIKSSPKEKEADILRVKSGPPEVEKEEVTVIKSSPKEKEAD
ncbi:MAG: hypothetical protein WCG27_00700, partial [Pseudomonadota bacterium]